jgi:hypothetical protein
MSRNGCFSNRCFNLQLYKHSTIPLVTRLLHFFLIAAYPQAGATSSIHRRYRNFTQQDTPTFSLTILKMIVFAPTSIQNIFEPTYNNQRYGEAMPTIMPKDETVSIKG